MALSEAQRRLHYGAPGKVTLADVGSDIPFKPRSTTGKIYRVRVHHMIADEFTEACLAAARVSNWRPLRIECYNPRKIRDSPSWSVHAWAMAIDMFDTPQDVYPPGGVWTPDGHFASPLGNDTRLDPQFSKFVDAFSERGWTWGGRFRRRTAPSGQTRARSTAPGMDTPHFEWSKSPAFLGQPVAAQSPTRYLKRGDTGAAVKKLQEDLLALYKFDPTSYLSPGTPDSDFGELTETAVKRFQAIYALQVDGEWGDRSASKYVEVMAWWADMAAKAKAEREAAEALAEANKPPTPPLPPEPNNNDEVRAALRTLSAYVEESMK